MTVALRLRAEPPRSWLFVPAMRAAEWLPKAHASGADAIIVDLEDATAPVDRQRAREIVRAVGIGSGQRAPVFVRINRTASELSSDVDAAVASGADGIVLPKVERPEDIHAVVALLDAAEGRHRRGGPLAIVALIETPRGVLRAMDVADADPRVTGLAFGAGDLAARAGLVRTRHGTEIALSRGLVTLAASAAGVGAFDTPFLDLADLLGLRAEATAVAGIGFSGKLVIHPTQVATVNQAFTPTSAEVAEARELLAAFDTAAAMGSGASRHKGRMIDEADAAQARRVLARADRGRSRTAASIRAGE